MNNNITKVTDNLPEIIKDSSFKFDLQGWPAALTIVGVVGCAVVMYAIDIKHQEHVEEMKNKEKNENEKQKVKKNDAEEHELYS